MAEALPLALLGARHNRFCTPATMPHSKHRKQQKRAGLYPAVDSCVAWALVWPCSARACKNNAQRLIRTLHAAGACSMTTAENGSHLNARMPDNIQNVGGTSSGVGTSSMNTIWPATTTLLPLKEIMQALFASWGSFGCSTIRLSDVLGGATHS